MSPILVDMDRAGAAGLAALLQSGHPVCAAVASYGRGGAGEALAAAEESCRLAGGDPPLHQGMCGPMVPLAEAAPSAGEKDPLAGILALGSALAAAPQQVQILALGPLTDLAMAFLRDPDGFSQAAGILLCGGAQLGYPAHSETAEYNLLCDPEAASVVLSCGVPVSVLPRETAAEAAAGLSLPEGGRWRALLDRDGGQGLLGAVGAAVAAEPSLIAESFACNLSVDTSGSRTRGQLNATRLAGTIIDGQAELLTAQVITRLEHTALQAWFDRAAANLERGSL